MCGCRKGSANQNKSAQSRAAQSRPAAASSPQPAVHISNQIVDLVYQGDNPTRDLANVPTGAHYVVRNGIVTVFSADVDALLARLDEDNAPVFFVGGSVPEMAVT